MDRSLDEIIGERPASRPRGGRGGRGGDRRPPPARAPRREEYPRDGVRKIESQTMPAGRKKPSSYSATRDGHRRRQVADLADQGVTAVQYRRDEPASIDSDWVHDRYEDDRYDRMHRRPPVDDDRPPRGGPANGSRVRVDNIHYDLTEDDLRELFERIGPVVSVRLLYDRADRSQGTAFVIYQDYEDARQAVRDFDGQNANGQPIRLQMMPSGPGGGPRGGSLADRIDKPTRSLFDRIEGGPGGRDDSRDDPRRSRRNRSDSPRKSRFPPTSDLDRYVPGRGSRSPIRRRGTPREGGRRPGQKREDAGRPTRRPRTDDEGRPLIGGRPRKTAEELDAEMADYWGSKGEADTANGDIEANGAAAGGDVDMIE